MRKILGISIISMLALVTIASAHAPAWDKNPEAFVHGIALEIDGGTWYFKGPGSVPGAIDVPGHTWIQKGQYEVEGRHYNVGPYNSTSGTYVPQWWAANEPDGVLLYKVRGIIAPEDLPEKTAQKLKKEGYVHRHELVDPAGIEHPALMVYLKHTAVREFYFNGGHMAPMSDHMVSPGIDYEFMPNW